MLPSKSRLLWELLWLWLNYKYQTTLAFAVFTIFDPVTALKNDKLFKQAAAHIKDQTFCWDSLKEDLLVWFGV